MIGIEWCLYVQRSGYPGDRLADHKKIEIAKIASEMSDFIKDINGIQEKSFKTLYKNISHQLKTSKRNE